MALSTNEIRNKYLKYYKDLDHEVIPSAPLMPENDPTTLFINSGMQPMLQYFLGEPYSSGSTRVVDSQICFRSVDIEEVGDNRHTTFFEMLGNWSFGDYWKEDQLRWLFQFLTKDLGLDPNKLYPTVFIGDEKNGISQDTESAEIWKEIFGEAGIEATAVELGDEKTGYKKGMQGGRVFYYGAKENWWSRAGEPEKMPVGEPGGPDSEIFYEFDIAHNSDFGEHCHPNCGCGKYLEICNSVFMEFKKVGEGSFEKLPKKNVDFGGGLERIAAAVNDNADMFEIDVFNKAIKILEEHSKREYKDENKVPMQIIADHLRAATFMIVEGLVPSNKQQGYILRRLIRNSVAKMMFNLKSPGNIRLSFIDVCNSYIDYYGNNTPYFDVEKDKKKTALVLHNELKGFIRTLEKGMKEALKGTTSAFDLYQTYGLPEDVIRDVFAQMGMGFDATKFEKEREKHKEASRTDSFKGGLGGTDEKSVWYHTLTHLLHQALRDVLGDEVKQAGSNITPERLRFDFSFDGALSDEEKKKIEDIVNEQKDKGLAVTMETMSLQEAMDSGALAFFFDRYGDTVNVYSVGDYSKEICGGPHVKNTSEIKGNFKIVKEKSSSAGVRRIRAVIE